MIKRNAQRSLWMVFLIWILLNILYMIYKHIMWVHVQSITVPKVIMEYEQRVPKIIHQTHKSNIVPRNMGKAFSSWIVTNPEYEHRYYTDSDMDVIMEQTHPRVRAAYDKLCTDYPSAGAMKADLFRLVLMYEYGGVYTDADTYATTPLRNIIQENDEFVSGVGARRDLHQWIIITIPQHPFVQEALFGTVFSIMNKKPYVFEHWTGPLVYNRSISRYCKNNDHELSIQPGEHTFTNTYGENVSYRIIAGDYLGNQVIFKYPGYMKDLKKMKVKHHNMFDVF